MGKRKATRKPKPKIKLKLDKNFTCHFCNQEKTIEIKIDREQQQGHLSCRNCGTYWATTIHNLTDAVDIYGDWIDACEAAKERAIQGNYPSQGQSLGQQQQINRQPIVKNRKTHVVNKPLNKKKKDDDEDSLARSDNSDDSDFEEGKKKKPTISPEKAALLLKKRQEENLPDFIAEDSDEDALAQDSADEESSAASTSSDDEADEKSTPVKKRRLVSARDLD